MVKFTIDPSELDTDNDEMAVRYVRQVGENQFRMDKDKKYISDMLAVLNHITRRQRDREVMVEGNLDSSRLEKEKKYLSDMLAVLNHIIQSQPDRGKMVDPTVDSSEFDMDSEQMTVRYVRRMRENQFRMEEEEKYLSDMLAVLNHIIQSQLDRGKMVDPTVDSSEFDIDSEQMAVRYVQRMRENQSRLEKEEKCLSDMLAVLIRIIQIRTDRVKMVETAIDSSELDIDSDEMIVRYVQRMRENQSQLEKEKEYLSDMLAVLIHIIHRRTDRGKLVEPTLDSSESDMDSEQMVVRYVRRMRENQCRLENEEKHLNDMLAVLNHIIQSRTDREKMVRQTLDPSEVNIDSDKMAVRYMRQMRDNQSRLENEEAMLAMLKNIIQSRTDREKMVDPALDSQDLDMDSEEMAVRYVRQVRDIQSRLEKEEETLSDMLYHIFPEKRNCQICNAMMSNSHVCVTCQTAATEDASQLIRNRTHREGVLDLTLDTSGVRNKRKRRHQNTRQTKKFKF